MGHLMRTLTLIGTLAIATGGCASSGMRTIRVAIGDASVKAELAETEGQRQRGLMYRQKLGTNRGMLFAYEDEQIRSFWMKNTYVPLSVAFIDDDGSIVHITDMQPRSMDSHSSIRRCRYVLEVNQGWFDEHGVEVGDVAEFEIQPLDD
jgi:uncharacterized protein